MKKLAFLFVAFAAVSFASCGNQAANTESSEDSVSAATIVEEATPATDSIASTDSLNNDSVKTVVAE